MLSEIVHAESNAIVQHYLMCEWWGHAGLPAVCWWYSTEWVQSIHIASEHTLYDCVFFFLIFSSLLYLLYLLKCNGLCRGFCGSAVKNLPANAGDVGLILGLIRSPEEGGATDSSIASEIPWTEPGMLQSTESWRVRHEVAAIQQQWYMYWT